MEPLQPIRVFRGERRPSAPGDDRAPANTDESETNTKKRRAFVCAACEAFLADKDDVVAIGGKTHHERVNPGAYVHRFVTLRRCDAAMPTAPPVEDFSWFDGYAWQIVQCAGCSVHLGWRFVGEGTPATFFGVLLARVRLGSK